MNVPSSKKTVDIGRFVCDDDAIEKKWCFGMTTASDSKVQRVQAMLEELDRLRLIGWRWAEMYDWLRDRLGDPALRPDAIRQLVSRARRRRIHRLNKAQKEQS